MTDRFMIGLAGVAGSGKSSAADILAREYGYVALAFADPLKELAGRLFSFSETTLYGPSSMRDMPYVRATEPGYWERVTQRAMELAPDICALFAARPVLLRRWEILSSLAELLDDLQALGPAFTPRAALRRLGTDWARDLWPAVWTNDLLSRIEAAPAARVVVTDVRFADEAAAVRVAGGQVAWVDASRRRPPPPAAHASEPTLAGLGQHVDWILDNNGTPADLRRRVALLVDGALQEVA